MNENQPRRHLITPIVVFGITALIAVVMLLWALVIWLAQLTGSMIWATLILGGVFALIALIVALVFLKGDSQDEDDEEDAPDGLVGKLLHLVRERPIIGAVGGLGAAFLLLRNPALAAIVASMVADRKMDQGGYGRRRRR